MHITTDEQALIEDRMFRMFDRSDKLQALCSAFNELKDLKENITHCTPAMDNTIKATNKNIERMIGQIVKGLLQ